MAFGSILTQFLSGTQGRYRSTQNTPNKFPLFNSVITESAFIRNFLFGMNVPAPIGACLNAITATNAVFLIHQGNPIRTLICCSNRADLCTGGFCTMVAHFRNEKCFKDILLINRLMQSVNATVGRFYF